MPLEFPFLTSYDPTGSSEGTIDPLGLYQIADQLAVELVPAVRERMQRIRALTAMAVGALVTEGLDGDPRWPDASPFLIWEWLVVESLVRIRDDDRPLWGVPGTTVARRALSQYGYLDSRSYLKTPRIFGFHGVYKRLGVHLGIVNVHLGPGPNTERLVDAWARGIRGQDSKALMDRWRTAVNRSLAASPPRTNPGWTSERWNELAQAFAPDGARAKEKQFVRELLHSDGQLGALPQLWRLQERLGAQDLREETVHSQLEREQPSYGALLRGIRAYEAFSRALHDAFRVLRAEATRLNAQSCSIARLADDADFRQATDGLAERFQTAYTALGEIKGPNSSLHGALRHRFEAFAEPLEPRAVATALCSHHEAIQRNKSADGRRPWFDRLGGDRIYLRQQYCVSRRDCQPGRYVHDYRGVPIGRFRQDLT